MIEKIALKTPGGSDFRLDPPTLTHIPDKGIGALYEVIQWISFMFMVLAVVTALFLFIWAGIQWVTSGGDKEKVASAQKKIVYGVIGLVIVLGSFMILNIIGFFFDVDFFT